MFILGLGIGMFVTSAVGTLALILESRSKTKSEKEPKTHYHITVDEDAQIPEFFREQLLKKPIDWTAADSPLNKKKV